MYNFVRCNPLLRNCIFRNNTSNQTGGAVYNEFYCNAVFEDCLFEDNTAGGGAGAVNDAIHSYSSFNHCEFLDNFAMGLGGAICHGTDGDPGRTLSLRHCTFMGNEADQGGAIHVQGDSTEPIEIVHCWFQDNAATGDNLQSGNNGGAINIGYNYDYTPVQIASCTFMDCTAGGWAGNGGAINNRGVLTVVNSVFNGNRALWQGGGIYCLGGSDITIINCTFVRNLADDATGDGGGGLYAHSTTVADIVNSILWDNSANGDTYEINQLRLGTTYTLSHTCIKGLRNLTGTNLIGDNPLFIWSGYQLVDLETDSPCIDFGLVTPIPLDGMDVDDDADLAEKTPDVFLEIRVQPFRNNNGCGMAVDLGAFEKTSNYDCDEDGIPDIEEIAEHPEMDTNYDGVVDACQDCDGDGILDPEEIADCTGAPECQDCNGNCIPDGCEPDCNENDIPDDCDIADGTSEDCNEDGVPNDCDPDCDQDYISDVCEIADDPSLDCDGNGILDECEIADGSGDDCDGNGILDECEIADGSGHDCDDDGIMDECELAGGTVPDCNANGILDECEPDCNNNGIPDDCDIADGTSEDCNGDGIPSDCGDDCNGNGIWDDCEIADGSYPDCNGNWLLDECEEDDCNGNGIPDDCDIAEGLSFDCSGNGVPNECEEDCDDNGVPDDCDILGDPRPDCDSDWVLDECEISDDPSLDCNANGILDECEEDCNDNGIPDDCDIADGTSEDCNGDGVPNECGEDCNGNGIWDACEIADGTSPDCSGNGVPDECEDDCDGNGIPDDCDIVESGYPDCNGNWVPDDCDIADGTSHDCNFNGTPDECDISSGDSEDCNNDNVPDECGLAPAPVEIVFVVDTSGSTTGDGNVSGFCQNVVVPIVSQLDNEGILSRASYISIAPNPDGDTCEDLGQYSWYVTNTSVYELFQAIGGGVPVPGDGSCGPIGYALHPHGESWGPATAVVADGWNWQSISEARRIIITLADEGPCRGDAQCDPDDLDAVSNAIELANGNQVTTYCVCGKGSTECVKTQASQLANSTGGLSFSVDEQPSSELGDQYADIAPQLVSALVFNPFPDCNANGKIDECDITGGVSNDCNLNDIPDECEDVPPPAKLHLYVDSSAPITNTGSNWNDALRDLTTALDYANTLPCGEVEIHVAQGAYHPSVFQDRDASFELADGVKILGGYRGLPVRPGQSPDDRNIKEFITVLDGDYGVRGDWMDNAQHIVTANNVDETAVLDGFLIRYGNAHVVGEESCGGGLLITSASPTIKNCTFHRNYADDFGGAIHVNGGSPRIINCFFDKNHAKEGGGLNLRSSSGTLVTNCVFYGNTAGYNGGGMRCEATSSPIVTNCTFGTNFAQDLGGGLFTLFSAASGSVTNCIFWENNDDDSLTTQQEAQIYNGGAGSIPVSYSCVQDDDRDVYPGTGNTDHDPQFDDTLHLRLSAASPCIDAGNRQAVPADVGDLDGDHDTTEFTPWDLDLQTRFVNDPNTGDTGYSGDGGPIPDMGAYEFQAPALLNHGSKMEHDTENYYVPSGSVEGRDIQGTLVLSFEYDQPVYSEDGNAFVSTDFTIYNGDFVKVEQSVDLMTLEVECNNVADGGCFGIAFTVENGVGNAVTREFEWQILAGDVNGDGAIDAVDLSTIGSNTNIPLDDLLFRCDVNANGTIAGNTMNPVEDWAIVNAALGADVQACTPVLSNMYSRKYHSATYFDIEAGDVEPRTGDKRFVFIFDRDVRSVDDDDFVASDFTVSSGTITNVILLNQRNEFFVDVSGITDQELFLISFDAEDDYDFPLSVEACWPMLIGDVNGSGEVDVQDAAQIAKRNGTSIGATSFRCDLDSDGAIEGVSPTDDDAVIANTNATHTVMPCRSVQ